MKRYPVLIICSIVWLGLATGLMVTRVAAESLATGSKVALSTVSPQSGVDPAALFGRLCSACHGATGEGGYGPALNRSKDWDDARLTEVIVHGQGKMPAVGGGLDSTEVEAIVRFIKGGLVVSRPASEERLQGVPSASSVLPARLTVDLSPGADSRLIARVALQSSEGEPIRGAPVGLYRSTVMGGKLLVAELTTDASGGANHAISAVKGQIVKVEATYAGGNEWGAAKAQASIEMQGTAEAATLISALTSRSTPPTLAAAFAAVLGGVWLTYGLVAYRLLQIVRQATRNSGRLSR